jgi:ABC-type nitrate/sulfonate/bicarbonate transport system substrate-binding protein
MPRSARACCGCANRPSASDRSPAGGAALVVRNGINSAADLKGKKLATPQLGNTQDVALRTWLLDNGLKTDTNGGGDVSVLPQDNAQTLQSFQSGTPFLVQDANAFPATFAVDQKGNQDGIVCVLILATPDPASAHFVIVDDNVES